ncbi:hypothetical protein L873DRAFT_644507 [Choiromyces venosus 120613-1]|uniref:Uncharacterized protein n=1 Tax=Choiromyces venosus 120613-1 TaxID=1336337 RepID=A0A3N4K6W6_9PEZI|nr:hypothetical protein L873DRAFT_644507 [Choiromyces venosus 120613-1]
MTKTDRAPHHTGALNLFPWQPCLWKLPICRSPLLLNNHSFSKTTEFSILNSSIEISPRRKMESSAAFLDLVFSESLEKHTIKDAHKLFSLKPYQLFDLLLKEERFTNFFARIELYGNNLANLLDQFPRFKEYDCSTMLLEEIIRSFALSLLSERFNDMKSRTAVARIVLSVVKLSGPTTLAHFGVRLGALPGILRILFAEGHIKQLALTHK